VPTLSTSLSKNTTANPSIGSMQPDSAIPVPTMVTNLQAPYTGPDLVTALPAEIFQTMASNLGFEDVKALRLTNKAAAAKSEFNLRACRHSFAVEMTKDGIRRGLHNLQTQYLSVSVTQVIFETSEAQRSAHVDFPVNGDVKALLDHLPNVTTVIVRDWTFQGVGATQIICDALAAAPRAKLTHLTIQKCALTFQGLKDLLNAHRQTLRYLVLGYVYLTDSPFTYAFLSTLKTDFGLTRVVLGHIHAPSGEPFQVLHPRHPVHLRRFSQDGSPEIQIVILCRDEASFTGTAAVQQGFQEILWRQGQ
jgi:hypothetical protein